MSLEAAIQENTSVMRELIGRLTAAGMMTGAPGKPEAAPADKPAKTAKAEVAAAEPETVKAIDYEKDVRPVLVKVSTTAGRDALIALLKQFGVTKGDQLKVTQFQDALNAANALLPVEV